MLRDVMLSYEEKKKKKKIRCSRIIECILLAVQFGQTSKKKKKKNLSEGKKQASTLWNPARRFKQHTGGGLEQFDSFFKEKKKKTKRSISGDWGH